MGELYRLDFANGKSYVGISTKGSRVRYQEHSRSSIDGDGLLYRAWRKHGDPVLVTLAIMENNMLKDAEIKAIAAYNTFNPNGYNRTLGGEGLLGLKRSDETKRKISIAQKGIPKGPQTQQHIENVRAALSGKKFTAEHLANVRIAAAALERRAKLSKALKGRKFTKQWLANMSVAARNITAETREKLRSIHRNRSPEWQEKLNAATRNRTPKTRALISAIMKRIWAERRKKLKP